MNDPTLSSGGNTVRRTLLGAGLIALGLMPAAVCEAGPPVHTPRKYEPPASGRWTYVPTWRDTDPNTLTPFRQRTLAKSLRTEDKFRSYFGDYIFMRPGTEMQYVWDVPSYKRSVR